MVSEKLGRNGFALVFPVVTSLGKISNLLLDVRKQADFVDK